MFCTDRASYFIQSKKFKNVDFIDFIDNHQKKSLTVLVGCALNFITLFLHLLIIFYGK